MVELAMFPRVAQHPQPQVPQFEPNQSQFQNYHALFKSLPNSPGVQSPPQLPHHGSNPQEYNTSQVPRQYAHPLQRHHSSPSHKQMQPGHNESSNASEHMLRRKTPNGTLSAGYDGTPVEWASKPHAMKHILLPAESSTSRQQLKADTPHGQDYKSIPIRPSMDTSRGQFMPMLNQGIHNSRSRGITGLGQDMQPNTWIFSPSQTPGMDSVLNQVPMQQGQGYFLPNGAQVPTVLQPTYQNALGPTASHEGGPYGPYWPNGAFIPYRPAAHPDPRFTHDPPNSPWQGQMNPNYQVMSNPSWPANNPTADLSSFGPEMGAFTSHTPSTIPLGIGEMGMLNGNHASTQWSQTTGMVPIYNLDISTETIPRPLTAIHNPVPGAEISRASNPYQQTIQQNSNQHLFGQNPTAMSDMARHSQKERSREQILSWAHTVYVNLLASIHHSKRQQMQQNRGSSNQQIQRANMYPKPPRHPSISQSHGQSGSNHTSERARQYHERRSSSQMPGDAFRQDQLWPDGKNGNAQPSGRPSGTNLETREDGSTQTPSNMRAETLTGSYGTIQHQTPEPPRTLRRSSGAKVASPFALQQLENERRMEAKEALELLRNACEQMGWEWIDGMLLGGCLAYGLAEYSEAVHWYTRILTLDSNHVEATSNLAATLLSLSRSEEAERYWLRAVKLRPSYFEAVEHLIGLLCNTNRAKEAVNIIDFVETSLRITKPGNSYKLGDITSEDGSETSQSSSVASEREEWIAYDFDFEDQDPDYRNPWDRKAAAHAGFGSSGYAIPGSENGRMLALVHAKGNMLYALGDNVGAARAFEDAVLIGAGRRVQGITGLIQRILTVVSTDPSSTKSADDKGQAMQDPVLLPPDKALQTAKLLFPTHGCLPGLKEIANDMAKKAAISTTSTSLLSLAKIFQDGMSSTAGSSGGPRPTSGVRDILALYYLSLALQPSPSTANNVGILLASVQQPSSAKPSVSSNSNQLPPIPGVIPGSGIALALGYYNYGLNLDSRHAHLYTNLGSLLKDIGQLAAAIKMYEKAVDCDGNFDIALANLANAVKDQGRISDAIGYYKRAVIASPDFAEAVCGLANALNSVCSWKGRGGILPTAGVLDQWHVDENGKLLDSTAASNGYGWMKRVVDIVDKQLVDGESWGKGTLAEETLQALLAQIGRAEFGKRAWKDQKSSLEKTLRSWQGQPYEGAKVVRLLERATRKIMWQWYQDRHHHKREQRSSTYARPQLPTILAVPVAPTVLPFHTFTCPLSAKQIRTISQRNGLRISCSTLRSPWLPSVVYQPPAPPQPHLNVGYVSSDFNNHPLAHLMQSVFGFHDPKRVKAFCYATTPSDNSDHRKQIEKEAPVFHDASNWSADRLINRIVEDEIHILVNLNGYTRGARNEIFAARPVPIQMSFMGFAGTLGAEWCDYLLADDTAVPPSTLRPWRRNVDLEDQGRDNNLSNEPSDWIYSENIIFARDTFFCCDHRQSAPDSQEKQLNWEEEQARRWKMRKGLFPNLTDDAVILGNFNQLYKIEPTTFRTWLRILARIPRAVLWLLRFPELGESNLKHTAEQWAGPAVASRIIFTDVAPKHQHISRARVCDLFLDTPECNAHTTAADVLWSGTPLLTLPRYKYKMCSRMAASILKGALPKSDAGTAAVRELIANSDEEYEEAAVKLGNGLRYSLSGTDSGRGQGEGRLLELRKLLYESRWTSALFDTKRWVRDLEEAYEEAWRKWVAGEGGDIWL